MSPESATPAQIDRPSNSGPSSSPLAWPVRRDPVAANPLSQAMQSRGSGATTIPVRGESTAMILTMYASAMST